MKCPLCGNENPVGQIFCGHCGAALTTSAQADREGNSLASHLATLTRQEIIREHSRSPELIYLFKHALTQEAAYNSLLLKQRKELHQRAGLALEQLFAERQDEFAPVLAQHFYESEDWARAAVYALRAGDHALKVYGLREALEHYSRALNALDKNPGASPEQLLDATLGWIEAAIKFRPYAELIERLARAEKIARTQDDKRRLTRILHWTANAHFAHGFTSRAAPALFENYHMASELGDERLRIVPSYYMALFMVDRDPRGALAQLAQVSELARKLGNADIEAHAVATQAFAHARLGEFGMAREEAQRALAFTGRRTTPLPEADLYNLAGFTYLDMGDAQRALEYAQRGAEKALAANAIECACAGNLCVALSQLQKQNLAEAQSAFTEAIRLAVFTGSAPFRNMGEGGLAIAQFLGGRAEAIQGIEAALQNAQAIDDQYAVALFAQTLGAIHMQGDELERAESYFNLALAYYRRNTMRPYLARSLQSLAQLYAKQGRISAAQQALVESEAMSKRIEEN